MPSRPGTWIAAGILLLAALPALNAQTEKSPYYTDLRNYPVFVKTGFEPADVFRYPDSQWLKIEPSSAPVRIKDLGLPGIPKRTFLSPAGLQEMDFTVSIPFVLDSGTADTMPGVFLASLGDNWEVYLNGHPVRKEMHLDGEGRIASHRIYRNILLPLGKSFLLQGDNLLCFRITGDPSSVDVGLFSSSSYYLDDYTTLVKEHSELATLILIGIYLFMGIYHLSMFLIRPQDRHNCYYGLFSLILGIYYLTRTSMINVVIPDSNITLRVEYFCVFLVIPLGAFFMETLGLQKIFFLTKIYGVFFALLAAAQFLFSRSFSNDILSVWKLSSIPVALIVFVYDVGYNFIVSSRELRLRYAREGKNCSFLKACARALVETPIGNCLVGACISISTGIFDVVDSMVLHRGISITRYGFFIFTAGTTIILARRFAFLYNQQRRIISRSNKGMNTKLVDWIVNRDRDPGELPSETAKNVIMFTDVRNFTSLSEGMSSQTLTGFISALNEVLATPLFAAEDKGFTAYTDKFMGDCMMNIFTDPGVALRSAVQLHLALNHFNDCPQRFFKELAAGIKVKVGTGIAYGPVTLGIMGHSRRLDYTPIGDTVNLASRLEGLTKQYRIPIIINDSLYRAVNSGSFNLRYIDRIRVKGKNRPVDIYEEFSLNDPAIRELKQTTRGRFQELQKLYFSGKDPRGALRLAKELIRQYKDAINKYQLDREGNMDYLPAVYARRIQFMAARPGMLARWDGVYSFVSK